MISLECPHCGHQMNIDDKYAGQEGKCANCKGDIIVPVQADRFEVKLTFDGIRERLVVPFSAVRMFFDPSVPYGLQFDEPPGDQAGLPECGAAVVVP